jgi:hypothetical protein
MLAGLGPGSTPAGDDFIIGAIYAAWILHPAFRAGALARRLSEVAVPLTTSLSGAWLRAAADGAAGAAWHALFAGLELRGAFQTSAAVSRLLRTGHTSGADGLAGFRGVFEADLADVGYACHSSMH